MLCADFNDDGTPDIVVNVGPKIVILDGTDYQTVLYTKEWNRGTTADWPIMRIAAGDVNNDGKTDLVVMKYFDNYLEVYWGGDLNSAPFIRSVYYEYPFFDIKVGDVTGDGAPDIVTFHHLTSRSWNDNYHEGYIWTTQGVHLQVYEWDGTDKILRRVARLEDIRHPTWDDPKDFVTEWDYNPNVTLVQRNGFTQAADIIVGQSIYSYDPDSSTGFTRVGDLEGSRARATTMNGSTGVANVSSLATFVRATSLLTRMPSRLTPTFRTTAAILSLILLNKSSALTLADARYLPNLLSME